MHVPSTFRDRRALAALGIAAGAVILFAPDLAIRGLPVIVLLACPLMMVFMMGPMHRMPAPGAAPARSDPYAPEALTRRLAELDAERAAIAGLLATPGIGPSADGPVDRPAAAASSAHAEVA